jgi:hypothetical protein
MRDGAQIGRVGPRVAEHPGGGRAGRFLANGHEILRFRHADARVRVGAEHEVLPSHLARIRRQPPVVAEAPVARAGRLRRCLCTPGAVGTRPATTA